MSDGTSEAGSSRISNSINANEELAKVLKEQLEIKDRKWRTKTYHRCFLASKAVECVMQRHQVDEETAVSTLNELRLAGYVQHVVDPNKHFQLGSQKLYFCFLDDELSHVKQKQKARAQHDLKNQKISGNNQQKVIRETDNFMNLQEKVKRMESAMKKVTDAQLSTQTKLEIVHQATISLIQALVATVFLLVVLVVYTLCIIVPSMNTTRSTMLGTTFLGTLLIGSFLAQGRTLFSIWLQVGTWVTHQDNGAEDTETNYGAESNSTAALVPAITGLHTKQRRRSSLVVKEPLFRKISRTTLSERNLSHEVQQRKQVDLPHPQQWPHRPVMVCVNTPVSTSLRVPTYGDGPCPIGKPFAFVSDLFEGQCLVRVRDVPNSDSPQDDQAYFAGRRRLFQTIVQGRFKQPLPVSDVLTGHEFVKPLQNLPHPWILKAATNLIGKLAPGAEIRVVGNQPSMLASLAATSQVVRGDEPGNEPDIASTDDIQEDCSLFGGIFSSGKISMSGRKLHLANPERAYKYTFDTDTVYTFDFYQSLLDVKAYSLELGVLSALVWALC